MTKVEENSGAIPLDPQRTSLDATRKSLDKFQSKSSLGNVNDVTKAQRISVDKSPPISQGNVDADKKTSGEPESLLAANISDVTNASGPILKQVTDLSSHFDKGYATIKASFKKLNAVIMKAELAFTRAVFRLAPKTYESFKKVSLAKFIDAHNADAHKSYKMDFKKLVTTIKDAFKTRVKNQSPVIDQEKDKEVTSLSDQHKPDKKEVKLSGQSEPSTPVNEQHEDSRPFGDVETVSLRNITHDKETTQKMDQVTNDILTPWVKGVKPATPSRYETSHLETESGSESDTNTENWLEETDNDTFTEYSIRESLEGNDSDIDTDYWLGETESGSESDIVFDNDFFIFSLSSLIFTRIGMYFSSSSLANFTMS